MDTQALLNRPQTKPKIVAKVTKINNLVIVSTQARKTSTKLKKLFETNTYQKRTQLSVLDRYKKRLDVINKEKDSKLEKRKKDKSKGILPKIKPFVGTFFKPNADPLKSIAQLAAFNAATKLAKGDILGTVGPGLTIASIIFGPKLLKMGAGSLLKGGLKTAGVGKSYEGLLKKLSKKSNLTKGEDAALKNFDRYRKAGLSAEEAAQRSLMRGSGYSVETAREFRRLLRSDRGVDLRVGERQIERSERMAAARGVEEGGTGAARSLGRQFTGKAGLLNVALAGFDFMARKSEGQTGIQAGLGAGAGAVGGIVGWQAGAALGAAIGSAFGGIGAVPGAIIGGIVGSFAGSTLASSVMDMITGVGKKTTTGFGDKSFATSLEKYEKVVNKFSAYSFGTSFTTTTPTGEIVPGEIQQVGQYRTGTIGGQQYGDPRPGGRQHAGVDLDLGPGDKQVTFLGGTVNYIGNDPGGYYKFVDIMTPTGYIERLAELGTLSSGIKVGARVSPGQVISVGEGPTGVTHLEYRKPGTSGFSGSVNPTEFLKKQGVMTGSGKLNYKAPAAGAVASAPSRQRSVESYTSYSPSPYKKGEIIPLPIPQQMQQMMQGTEAGSMVIPGPSEQDLLNSFYKRVLLNTVA